MTGNNRVDYEVRGNLAWIGMNRAPVNAVDHAMIDAIHDALKRADDDPALGAIVLASSIDGVFCGGMDLKMVDRGDALALRAFVDKFYMRTMDIQYALTKPTVAVIGGPARGAGMTLAITCDVAIAADDIDLGYPEIDVGVIPAIHYVHLPRQISRNKAFELLFGGRRIPAAEALALGLVNRTVPRDELAAAATEMATMFAAKSPTIMKLGRRSFHRAADLDYRRNVENQIETLCNVFATADGREGVRAFVEKRAPEWGDPVR